MWQWKLSFHQDAVKHQLSYLSVDGWVQWISSAARPSKSKGNGLLRKYFLSFSFLYLLTLRPGVGQGKRPLRLA